MNHSTFLAFELAHERARDLERAAERQRLVALAVAGRPARRSLVRRPVALSLAAVSRASAAVARRLDARVADDLGRALASTE